MSNGYKVALLGDSNVIKTILLSRWTTKEFNSRCTPTLGVGYTKVMVDNVEDGYRKVFHVYDTAGQERYSSISLIYCRDALAGMIVFDLTERSSFESVKRRAGSC